MTVRFSPSASRQHAPRRCGCLRNAGVLAEQTPEVRQLVLSDQAEEATNDTSGRIRDRHRIAHRASQPGIEQPDRGRHRRGDVENADITLETFLNTLPQANPAGTTTSNNPGNGGAANINLRGLGANRNLVLIDGRRPMVGATDQSVDLNTIPQGLIERIEVITGGAGATYGADAIAGAVNIIMKDDFEGVEFRGTYSSPFPKRTRATYQIAATFGGNFDEGRGNLAVSVEYADRQSLAKGQREFAAQAVSTTGTPPVGRLIEVNSVSQAALNAVFGAYGVPLAQVPLAGNSLIHFNADDTLFSSASSETRSMWPTTATIRWATILRQPTRITSRTNISTTSTRSTSWSCR